MGHPIFVASCQQVDFYGLDKFLFKKIKLFGIPTDKEYLSLLLRIIDEVSYFG